MSPMCVRVLRYTRYMHRDMREITFENMNLMLR